MADLASRRLLSGLCAVMLSSSLLLGCDKGSNQAAGSASEPGSPPNGAPDRDASPPASNAAGSISGAPAGPSATSPTAVGAALEDFIPLDKKACNVSSNEVGRYLKRGELAIAGREGAVGVAWLIDLTSKVQVAFAGFDSEAKQVLRGRGVGLSREHAPRVFATGADWTVAWLDPMGLAYIRAAAQTMPAPGIEHLSSISPDTAEYAAVASTPGGALVAVAPFGPDRAQLALFLFAPSQPDAPPIQAVGVTKHAKGPKKPAIAADAGGYYITWFEEGGQIAASHFDAAGKEGDATAVMPATHTKREHLSIVAAGDGAVVLWMEGDTIQVRGLDRNARPLAAPHVVGRGKWPALASNADGAYVAWVGKGRTSAEQLLVTRLAPSGAPAPKGLEVTDGNAVQDPVALAFAGARIALAWTEGMAASVSTKRLTLRLFDPSCVPAHAP